MKFVYCLFYLLSFFSSGIFAMDNLSSLHIAIANHDSGMLAFALAVLDCDINQYASDGLTPLHRAAIIGDIDIIKVLLDAGADPLLRVSKGRYQGRTADQCAVYARHAKLARLLKNVRLRKKKPAFKLSEHGDGIMEVFFESELMHCVKPIPQLPLHAVFIAELLAEEMSLSCSVERQTGHGKRLQPDSMAIDPSDCFLPIKKRR